MTDTSKAGTMNDIIRSLVALFDKAAYFLLGMMYQIFFNVASADLFNNGTILNFYKRIQLIIGIFMIFVLAVTIIKGILNPDTITDSKSGASSLITRVMISLILLAVLVPINIPTAKTEYEIQLNNNGLLFGTLYSLQNRILKNNTLGRLVLGTNDLATTNDDDQSAGLTGADKQAESLKESANIFTSTILKGFIRINLIPGESDDTVRANRICPDMDQDSLDIYTNLDSTPNEIIGLVNESCSVDKGSSWYNHLPKSSRHAKMYAFATNLPFVSAIVGFIFVFVLLDFTIQIAVRAIKLAILRLIAPIPVISYMNPLGSKDNAFNSWVKALTSTYLDLFIRLIIIYFVIYLIQDMMVNGIVMNTGSGLVGILSAILIWIGLFIFAQQAPKFIKQILGIKDDGDNKLFGGLGKLAGIGAAAAGGIGAFNAARIASRDADITRKAYEDENIDPNSLRNRGKHLLAGIVGGVAGVGAGVGSALGAKDHALRNTMETMQKRNAQLISRGSDGSTLFGRMGSTARNMFMGEGSSAGLSREIATLTARQKALEAVKSRMASEMVKKDWTYGKIGDGAVDTAGRDIKDLKFNYKDVSARYAAAKAQGLADFEIIDDLGHAHTISLHVAERNIGLLQKNNEDDYIQKAITNGSLTAGGVTYGADDVYDKELVSYIDDAKAKGATVTNRKSVTGAVEDLGIEIREKERQNTINKANDRFAGDKK